MGENEMGAVYLLGLVMADPSFSVLLMRALADLAVNGEKGRTMDVTHASVMQSALIRRLCKSVSQTLGQS